MKNIVVRKSSSVLLSLAACAGLGCSSSPTPATGGTGGSGGVLGSGGAVAGGGATGKAGSAASGGAASVGGAQGGVASPGGATGQGGAAASAGAATYSAGATATGGNPSASGGATATGGTSASGGTTNGAAVSIFDGKTLDGWLMYPPNSFSVNAADGAIASTGNVRGVCYTQNKYSFYRVRYTVRQVHAAGDNHSPGILFFGTEPTKNGMWAVQFALPQNWGWDYRGGANAKIGTSLGSVPNQKINDWESVEVLVDTATGTARAAVAQPVGTKAIEVVKFQDASTPQVPSYFAILCHTGGQLDEYKDITIEANPTVNDLITTK
jgi:Domain of Unknown Function (DUF1080)